MFSPMSHLELISFSLNHVVLRVCASQHKCGHERGTCSLLLPCLFWGSDSASQVRSLFLAEPATQPVNLILHMVVVIHVVLTFIFYIIYIIFYEVICIT